MALQVARRGLTLKQFLALPEEKPALEYEDGEVLQKASPTIAHSLLQGGIVELVNLVGRPTKGAVALSELRIVIGGRAYVPDVSIITWDRVPVDAKGRLVAPKEFAEMPAVAIEIVSPEQSTNFRVRRCAWYVANGARASLLVDAADESVIVFRAGQPPRPVRGAERIDLDDVVPGLELTAEAIFAALTFG